MGKRKLPMVKVAGEPLWYKDAIIYEAHVRSFLDSNADGIGDFPGLTQKLDYLRDLGVTAIWLLPFYPSPLKDDGYDIADYYSVNPIYGTLADFKAFLHEAHERQLRVITELVVNHTSDQHPWFQRSRRARPGSAWRDYYVWSDTPEKYKAARIIFRDFEPSNWTWDPIAQAYFWHRFYSHQPDLNFDNPQVHKEITSVLDFWFDLGVDGLRLDAVPYLYEREGTSCENLSETHEYLKSLRRHVDEKYGDRMLLAEANQWPEDAVTYFGQGQGDECHMAFHFPLMPRIFMAVRMEDRVPIVDILEQTPPIPETSQWALFLRNHDELTLEMVTDEERDYMYRVYANDVRARINLGIRRRLAPLLGNDRNRIELLFLLLFSLPGTPVLYYGDEIGMGDNVFLGDRNGVRTPMQWSSDKNAGFSRANPHALYLPIILDPEYHYEAVNVEAQQQNSNSLWWWIRRALTLRKRSRAFGRGSIQFLQPQNRKVLAFTRTFEEETILVTANLSRFPQPVQLDLSEFKDALPVELFGRTEFPAVTDQPYFLTLAPHAAFWFSLERTTKEHAQADASGPCRTLVAGGHWEEVLGGHGSDSLENCLVAYLKSRRWFGGKGRAIKSVQVSDAIDLAAEPAAIVLLVLTIEYREGDSEEYVLPVAFAVEQERQRIESSSHEMIITRVRVEASQAEGVLYEALGDAQFCRAIFEAMARRRSFKGMEGQLIAAGTSEMRAAAGNGALSFKSSLGQAEQSNSGIVFGDQYFLKLFRRIESGINPDLELGRFLTEKAFPNIAPVAGSLELQRPNGERSTLGILTRFVPNTKDAWEFTLDTLSRYFERIRSAQKENPDCALPERSLLDLAEQEPPEHVVRLLGTYFEAARLLGQRTAEMHLALASEPNDPNFAPEPFTPFYQRALYQSMRNLVVQNLDLLRRNLARVPQAVRPDAEKVAGLESQLVARLKTIHETPISAKRIRCHGDFHLGQVLHTGKDFIIIDFEGEPARPLGERRIKRSPLRDVAGMIRSFDYATHAALSKHIEIETVHEEHLARLEPWTVFWHRWVSAVYLRAYLAVLKNTDLLPAARTELEVLLDAHLLEKAIYEVGYELNNRPNWSKIPLRGILQLFSRDNPCKSSAS
ncbi:MAG: maltose alpha-D-glucosyltransferase / alpha-amylase [Verrucomicrobiota bacterium]